MRIEDAIASLHENISELTKRVAELERAIISLSLHVRSERHVLCRAHITSAISLASGTDTVITWDTVDESDGIIVSGSQVIVPVSGMYHVFVRVVFASGGGNRRIQIHRYNSGGFYVETIGSLVVPAPSGLLGEMICTTLARVDQGDYFTVEAFQDSGAALNLTEATLAVNLVRS